MLKSKGAKLAKRHFFIEASNRLRHSYIESPPWLRLFSASRAEVERRWSEGTAELSRPSAVATWNVKIGLDFNSHNGLSENAEGMKWICLHISGQKEARERPAWTPSSAKKATGATRSQRRRMSRTEGSRKFAAGWSTYSDSWCRAWGGWFSDKKQRHITLNIMYIGARP